MIGNAPAGRAARRTAAGLSEGVGGVAAAAAVGRTAAAAAGADVWRVADRLSGGAVSAAADVTSAAAHAAADRAFEGVRPAVSAGSSHPSRSVHTNQPHDVLNVAAAAAAAAFHSSVLKPLTTAS